MRQSVEPFRLSLGIIDERKGVPARARGFRIEFRTRRDDRATAAARRRFRLAPQQ